MKRRVFHPKTQLSQAVLAGAFITLGLSACVDRTIHTDLVVSQPMAPPVTGSMAAPVITTETTVDPLVAYDPSKDAMSDAGYNVHRDVHVGMYTGSQMESALTYSGPNNFYNPNTIIR